jgi:hypothetical protein
MSSLDLLCSAQLVWACARGQGSEVPEVLYETRCTNLVLLRGHVVPVPVIASSLQRISNCHYLVYRPGYCRR